MFKKIRIGVLLFILFLVAAHSYLTHERVTDWDQSLSVVIYPLNAEADSNTAAYLEGLSKDDFRPLEQFFQREAKRYSLSLVDPVLIDLAPEIHDLPPAPPFGANILAVMWWSLRLRFWAWKNDTYKGPLTNIQVFILYYDPQKYKQLDHSLGLKEGHICLVKAFGGRQQTRRNNVVIAHEILHTLGAHDKYDLKTLEPIYPDGYADPEQKPLRPQKYAEIMGRAIPLSDGSFITPDSLDDTLVGPKTAREIRWRR